MVPDRVLLLIRYAVFAVFALAVLVALASWLVRTRRLSPFGLVGRALRNATDPLMRPVERRVVRSGGNPVQAGWWLIIGVAIIGVLVVSLAQWIVNSMSTLTGTAHAGGRAMLVLAIGIVYDILFYAIVVRVIASWLGRFRYSPWLRPVYWLTDWIVEPIRRVLPAFGPFDFSPLVALLVLWALKQFVFLVLL
jgi:YggT family protein